MNYADEIDEYVNRLEDEMTSRGRLYEKYGSAIQDSLAPLWELIETARMYNPFLVLDFLKEFFA